MFLVFLVSLFPIGLHGQQPCVVDRDLLTQHVYILASDSMQGRMTGEPGQQMAAAYIAGQYGQIGLVPVIGDTSYFQEFTVFRSKPATMRVQGVRVEVETMALSAGYEEFAGDGTLYFSYKRSALDVDKLAEENGFVLLQPRNPRHARRVVRRHYREGVRRFALVADSPLWTYHKMMAEFYEMRYRLTEEPSYHRIDKIIQGLDSVQVMIVTPGQMSQMIGFNPDFGLLEMDSRSRRAMVPVGEAIAYSKSPMVAEEIVTENVVGMIHGTRGLDEVVVVTAHYDHMGVDDKGIHAGADDNASGTAALIEIARVLQCMQDSGEVFNRSVVFVAFSAEEVGLLGSEYFVTSEPFRAMNPLMNINMDMIGRSVKYSTFQAMRLQATATNYREDHSLRESYVYLMNKGRGTRRFVRHARRIASNDHPGFTIDRSPGLMKRITYRYGSDHASFIKEGIPVMVWFTGLHPDYHTPRDTPDRIDYENMTRITDVILKTTLQIISE